MKNKGLDSALPDKTADEWQGALDRFRKFAGTEDIGAITRLMVKTFLADVALLPSRPKKAVGELPYATRSRRPAPRSSQP